MTKRGRPKHPDLLTPREQEVLALIRDGLTNPQIAERLGIGVEGVKYHVSEILSKLQVSSREEAASWREDAHPWWLGAFAFFRPPPRAASIALATGVVVAAVAGLVLMAVLLWRSDRAAMPPNAESALPATPSVAELLADFTPVVVELTPPPEMDTSDWLTYRDEQLGFELRYPAEAVLERNSNPRGYMGDIGRGTLISLPIASGTTLSEKYLLITTEADPRVQVECIPADLLLALRDQLPTSDVRLIRTAGTEFWSQPRSGVALHHYALSDVYLAKRGDVCVALSGAMQGVSPGAFADPPPTPTEDDTSRTILTAMVATFRWLE